MTTFPAPLDQRIQTDMSALFARVAVLEKQAATAKGSYAALPCTSTTRPANPNTGQEIYETDTGNMSVWSGSAWETMVHEGLWTTYTPSWTTTGTAPAFGTATVNGRYCKIGRQVTVSIWIDFSSSSTFGTGAWTFSLPAAAPANTAQVNWMGAWWAAASGNVTVGTCVVITSLIQLPDGNGTSQNVDATHPFTWGSGNQFAIQLTYESTV